MYASLDTIFVDMPSDLMDDTFDHKRRCHPWFDGLLPFRMSLCLVAISLLIMEGTFDDTTDRLFDADLRF
jgi:hypothetical protein